MMFYTPASSLDGDIERPDALDSWSRLRLSSGLPEKYVQTSGELNMNGSNV